MNLGALLLITLVLLTITANIYQAFTSARHFVMDSLCVVPFDSHNNPLRSRHYYTHLTKEETAYLAIEPRITRLLNLNSNSSLLTARIVITHCTFSPCTNGAGPRWSP